MGRFVLHYFFISRLIRLTTRYKLKKRDAEINPSNADDNGIQPVSVGNATALGRQALPRPWFAAPDFGLLSLSTICS